MKYRSNLNSVVSTIERKMHQRMGRAVAYLQREVIKSLGVSAGKNGQKGASAPGQPPRYRTGFLKQSIHTSVSPAGVMAVRGKVGAYGPAYARILELGGTVRNPGGQPYIIMRQKKTGKVGPVWIRKSTVPKRGVVRHTKPHSITILPRPYLSRALHNNREKLRRELTAPGII